MTKPLRSTRLRPRDIFGLLVMPLVILATTACDRDAAGSPTGSNPAGSSSTPAATEAAAHFLDTYVTGDGRVLRTDQGGDIVSEGQAYAMLVAELAGREELVATIWGWTKEHLRREDGLLSYRAGSDGTVLGADPAADADVLAAYALLTYEGPDQSSLHQDGEALAKSVLAHELVYDAWGRPVLVAGPWAVATSIVNPSYLMPSVFEELSSLTGDDTWSRLAESSTALVRNVTKDGNLLPPDWSRLDGSQLVPVADANGAPGEALYGPDAQRVPLWLAASCSDEDRRLAGQWWAILQQSDRSSATTLTTGGQQRDTSAQPIALLAAAAAARASGDTSGAADLSQGATEAAQGNPSYYGDAWLALAQALTESSLTTCG